MDIQELVDTHLADQMNEAQKQRVDPNVANARSFSVAYALFYRQLLSAGMSKRAAARMTEGYMAYGWNLQTAAICTGHCGDERSG